MTMVMDLSQTSTLGRFRKQKTMLGSVALTLFLAGWLNVLLLSCLMAAPIDDCYGSALLPQSAPSSGNVATLPDQGVVEFSTMADCESMLGCDVWDEPDPAVPSLDLEKKFFASVASSVKFESVPVAFDLPLVNQKHVLSQVPLFIQNCAFLI